MRKLVLVWLTVLTLAGGVLAQGPLTNALNLSMRTDSNGYLITSSAGYTASDGPLTALGNLRLRTDANGYLLTTFGASGSGTTGPSGIATTSTDGFVLENSTAATVGVPVQQSPRLRFRSQVWNSTAVAATNTNDWFIESVPTTGATPVGVLKFGSSLNGAAATFPFSFSTVVGAGSSNIDSSTGLLTLGGNSNVASMASLRAGIGSQLGWSSRSQMLAPTDGSVTLNNAAIALGSTLKFDALPTIASGFGTSPAITAGSTPLAGSINVGTGGTATTGVINFNGTAYPSAPFCIVTTTTTTTPTRVLASTTQLTLNSTVAWLASDVVNWHCVSSR